MTTRDTTTTTAAAAATTTTSTGSENGHLLSQVNFAYNYNSHISWPVFVISVPLETGMNTL